MKIKLNLLQANISSYCTCRSTGVPSISDRLKLLKPRQAHMQGPIAYIYNVLIHVNVMYQPKNNKC